MTTLHPPRSMADLMRPAWVAVWIAFGAMAWTPAQAQPTYKCGNTYSQKPCEGAATIDAADKRSAEQKAQAQTSSEREKNMGNQLESERLSKEKRAATDLKKAEIAQKAAAAKTNQTKLRPIKNKKIKPERDAAAEKPVKKNQRKKTAPAAGN